MSSRAEVLASKVEGANKALIAAIEGSSEDQWKAGCADGEWSQGFAGYHAANSIGFITGMVKGMTDGAAMEPVHLADIDAMNAQSHSEHANCTKAEALDLARTNSPMAVAMVRGLSDEQLDRKAKLALELPEMTVEQVAEMLLVGHPAGHTESIVKAR